MLTLILFGIKYSLDNGDILPLHYQAKEVGSIKNLGNIVSIAFNAEVLVNEQGATHFGLRIPVNTVISINTSNFSVTLQGQITASIYSLALSKIKASIQNEELIFSFDFNDPLNKLVFANTIGQIFNEFKVIRSINFSSGRAEVQSITFDFSDNSFDLFINPKQHFDILDSIIIKPPSPANPKKESLDFLQRLDINRIKLREENKSVIILQPEHSYLPFFPDVISMNRELVNRKKELQIKYQMAFANGVLCLEKTTAGKASLYWTSALFSEEAPVLVLKNFSDAHSNPVVVKTETNQFGINFRDGLDTLLNDTLPDFFQKTICGLSIESLDEITLHALHYSSVNWELKEKQLYNVGVLSNNQTIEALTNPFWLAGIGKAVVLDVNVPKIIYCSVKGMWLERKATVGVPNIKGSIVVSEISHNGKNIYYFPVLNLSPDHWDLRSQYEERESMVFDAAKTDGVYQTDHRKFIHNGTAQVIQLPTTDYLLGASNIVDPAAKEKALIPDRIKEQIKVINTNFNNTYSFVPSNEEHIQGFLRKSIVTNGIKPDALFLYPSVRAVNIVETVAAPLQLEHNQLGFSHGDYREQTTKALKIAGAGKKSLADEDVESLFVQLQHLWNDYLDIAEKTADAQLKKAAESVRNIRMFLENMQGEQEQNKLRVRIKDQLFYRLRFDKLAPTADNKEMLLQQVKRFAYGNTNAIPGLGKKIKNFSIKIEIDQLTIATLEQKWNTAWEDLNTETDKTLYLLFDFVYKQFDRAILNNLITIALSAEAELAAIREDVKEVIQYLRPGIDVKILITELKNNVDDEINELLSSVAQGTDPYFDRVRNLWETVNDMCPGMTPAIMHQSYGPHFDINTFKTILKDLKSNEPNIREQAKKIIHCLENKLKQEIKNELLKKWEELTLKPWNDIKAWFTSVFEPYEEDIRAFYEFILRVQGAKENIKLHIAFIRKLSKVKNAGELKALINDPSFKPVYNEISGLIKEHYGEDLKKIEQLTTAELNALIDEHWDKIMAAAEVIEMLTDEFNAWQQLITDLKKAVDDVRFKVTKFIDDLQDENKRKVFLRILIKYLIEKFQVHISIPDLRVDPPQYIVYSKHLSFNADPQFSGQMQNLLRMLHRIKLPLCKFGNEKQWNYSLTESSVYILKLGNDMDFASILTEINNNNKRPSLEQGPFDDRDADGGSPLAGLIADLHPEINTKSWRGLLILKPFADIRDDKLLGDIVGKSSLQMIYAAIGGTQYPLGESSFNVYARIKEDAQKMEVQLGDPADISKQPDAHFTLIKFDALIKNTKLESGDALLQLDFKNLFGKTPGEGPDKFRSVFIRGSVPVKPSGDNTPKDFEFAVTFHPEVEFGNLLGFIKSLELRGIKASRQAGRSVLEIDGTLNFKEFDVIVNVKKLALRNFYIILPPSDGVESPAGKPRGVNFDIGAIEFNIDIPRPINFSGLELIPKGIGFIKKAGQEIVSAFNRTILWIKENGPGIDLSFTYFKIDIQFGKLPSLGGTNLQDLKVEGVIGFKIKDGKIEGPPHFGINGISASELSIDLFRFLSLHIKELLVRNAFIGEPQTPVTFMGAKSIDLKILDWSPLGKDGNLSLAFIHNRPQTGSSDASKTPNTGMIAAYSNKEGLSLGVLKLYWILLAHNIEFSRDILLKLISPASLNTGDDEAMTEMMTGIFQGIRTADEDHHFKDISLTNRQSWLFGASFAVANVLDRCSFILHDQYFYGVLLSSTQPWFEKLFGTDTLSMAYMPGPTKQQDRFRIEMKLPFLDLIGSLQSGLTALEYGLNRDFLVDFGFPWKSGNTYLWDRTFSIASGIYETRFGFYFEKRTDVTLTGEKLLTIGAGVALSYGYRVGARTIVAYAEAGISVFVILMGSVTFRFPEGTSPANVLKGTIHRIDVVGVIGIYAYARGGINYWVLTAEIRAEVVAALAGHLIYMPSGNSSLTFSATLSVRYAASCRVKIGFVKISFSVSGSLGYGVEGRIALN